MYSSLSPRENSEGGRGRGEDFHSFDVQFPVRNDNRAIEVYIEIFGNLLLGISFPFDFPFFTQNFRGFPFNG